MEPLQMWLASQSIDMVKTGGCIMCNNQEKQKRPCEQEKKPKLLTDTEANQASGGVYVPDTSSFVMSGGAINEGRQESNGVVGTGLIM